MIPCEKDQEMRRLFQDLKEREAARSPPFDRLLREARSTERARPGWNLWVRMLPAAALALAVVVVSARLLTFRPDRQPGPAEPEPIQVAALSLAQWESPTDSLLMIPSEEWLSSELQLDTSVQDELLAPDATQRVLESDTSRDDG